MAQPLFVRLHALHPGLQLDAVAPRWVAPVLQRMAEITDVIDSPFGHGQLSLKPRWRLARILADRRYDAVYVLPNSLKSALVPWMASIPRRVGFTGESRYGLINIRHRLDKLALPLMVERFAQLAEAPGRPLKNSVPRWRASLRKGVTPSGCSGRPKTMPLPKKLPNSRPGFAATCAAPPRWPRPSICWPWLNWSSAMTPA